MVLYEGRMIAFGPREQIFARVAQAARPATPRDLWDPRVARAEATPRRNRGVPA